MRKLKPLLAIVFAILITWFIFGCGSGSSSNDNGDGEDNGQAGIATLSGTIAYEGNAEWQGKKVVIGLIEEWPMTGPPKQYEKVEIPDGGFSFNYQIDLKYTGPFYLAAFLDVDSTDGVMMNVEIDPMDLPTGDPNQIVEGENQMDFALQDPEDLGYGQ